VIAALYFAKAVFLPLALAILLLFSLDGASWMNDLFLTGYGRWRSRSF